MLAGGKGGVGRGEGGREFDDDGGGVAAVSRRRAMAGVPRARTNMGNRGVSGRMWVLTRSNSTPHDLITVSCDNGNDEDIIPHVPVVASAVGVVPAWPAVELRDVGVGVGWDRQSSTTTTPLALPSSCGTLPVVVVVFGAARPQSRAQIRRSRPSLENGGRARSQGWGQRRRRFHRESSSSSSSAAAASLLKGGRGSAVAGEWSLVAGSKKQRS